LLLGRAPPARGLPLLVVKGRERPPSPRKGPAERSELERSELELPEVERPELGRAELERLGLGRAALERSECSIGSMCRRDGALGPRFTISSASLRGAAGPEPGGRL